MFLVFGHEIGEDGDMAARKMTERELGETMISAISAIRALACDGSGLLSGEESGMLALMESTMKGLLSKKVAESRERMAARLGCRGPRSRK